MKTPLAPRPAKGHAWGPACDLDQLVVEDGKPADNFFVEWQYRSSNRAEYSRQAEPLVTAMRQLFDEEKLSAFSQAALEGASLDELRKMLP